MQLLARAEQQSKEMPALMKRDFESNESDKSPKIKGKEQTVYTHFFEFLLIFIIIQSSNLIVPSHLCVIKSIFPHGLQVTSC